MYRRASAQVVLDSIIPIQPMTRPAGLVFYLDFAYGSYKIEIVNLEMETEAMNLGTRPTILDRLKKFGGCYCLVLSTQGTVGSDYKLYDWI